MTFAHVIGRDYEYRVRNWFVKKGWSSERNPLSGASDQIEEELGKHDVRAWRDDLNIFLQIECKKTMKKKKTKSGEDDDTLIIQKEWLDKIDFENDEFLVFSYNRCHQHFAFMPEEIAEKVIGKLNLKKTETYTPRGDKGFGFKRDWVEGRDTIHVSNFLGRTWYTFDLEVYVDAREKYKIPTQAVTLEEQMKSINDIKVLKELFDKENSDWDTKQMRLYYSKLERLETGNSNAYNPSFIKEGQFWLDEKDKFDWDENTVDQISEKVQAWVDKNLEEDDEGNIVWAHNSQPESLKKDIKRILGLDKK